MSSDALVEQLHLAQELLEKNLIDLTEIKSALAHANRQRDTYKERLKTVEQNATYYAQKFSRLKIEHEDLQQNLLSSECKAQEKNDAFARLTESNKRQDLELRDLKEKITLFKEREMLKNAARQRGELANDSLKSNLASERRTRADLVAALHTVQERLERELRVSKKLLTSAETLAEVYRSNPLLLTYQAAICTNFQWRNNILSVSWEVAALRTRSSHYARLAFEIRFGEAAAGIFIQKNSLSGNAFEQFVTDENGIIALLVAPKTSHVPKVVRDNMLFISRSDFLLLSSLATYIPTWFRHQAQFDESDLSALHLATTRANLVDALYSWRRYLRFDNVVIVSSKLQSNSAEVLISLENVSLGDDEWPRLNYKLISVWDENGKLGDNPRLDLSAEAPAGPEIENEYPAKSVELQFAAPAHMDLSLWRSLKVEDRILVAELLRTLDIQFERAEVGDEVNTDGAVWKIMKNSLRDISHENPEIQAYLAS